MSFWIRKFLFLLLNARTFTSQESFRVTFLGKSLVFSLDHDFSAHKIALSFSHNFDIRDPQNSSACCQPTHVFRNDVIALRDLIENIVASSLGPERIEAAFDGKDPTARIFLESVCKDFPKNHGLPYENLTLRTTPLRIIDGTSVPFSKPGPSSSPFFATSIVGKCITLLDSRPSGFTFFNEFDVLEVRARACQHADSESVPTGAQGSARRAKRQHESTP